MGEQLEIQTAKSNYIFPLDRYYFTGDPGHIWFYEKEKSIFRVGFDYFGQLQAGSILHIRTRSPGREYAQGTAFGTVESEKWIGPLRLPVTAKLLRSNTEVLDNPSKVNDNPYEAWIVEIEPTKLADELTSMHNIISRGDATALKEYVVSELIKYEDPPI